MEWAVLSAYARWLPPGPERQQVRQVASLYRPERYAPSLGAAEDAGLTSKANLTPKGLEAARHFIRNLHKAAA